MLAGRNNVRAAPGVGLGRIGAAICLLVLAVALVLASSAAAAGSRETSLEVSCAGPVAIGQASSCTATVKDTAAGEPAVAPSGTVELKAASGSFAPACTLAEAGEKKKSTCTTSYTPTAAGTIEVTAEYAGDSEHAAAAPATTKVTVERRISSAEVSCVGPVVIGQPSTCTATVKDGSSGTPAAAPSGTVVLKAASGSFSPACTLAEAGEKKKSTCTTSYTPTAAGTIEVTAEYAGDAEHAGAAAPATTKVTVGKRAASVELSCTGPVVIGQGSTCTATVTDASPDEAVAPLSGSVELEVAGAAGPKCTLTPVPGEEKKKATCATTYTPKSAGTIEVEAEYIGGGEHGAAEASTHLTVGKRVVAASVVCAEPVVVGQAATCTVTVTDGSAGSAAAAPSGTVVVKTASADGKFAPACTLAEAGEKTKSTCTTKYTAAATGAVEITAEYAGDTEHEKAVSSPSKLVVGSRAATVSVTCGGAIQVGQSATCTVVVLDKGEAPSMTPTGEVVLSSDTAGTFTPQACPLGKGAKEGEAVCVATYTPSQVGSGTHTITAEYLPSDGIHASGTGKATLAVSAKPATTTTTTTTGGSTPPGAPKCRLVATERWRTVKRGKGKKAHKVEMPTLGVTYTCDENATVNVGGTVTIPASGHGKKRKKAKTLTLASAGAPAGANQVEPAVVLTLPPLAVTTLASGVHTPATVRFMVANANGAGVATLKLILVPPPRH